MNRAWNQRRRWTRLQREIRQGMKVIHRDPDATVLLPEGLALISWERYRLLGVAEEEART